MRNILLIPTCIITLINTSKLNKIVSQNERTEDGTALLLPSPSAVLGRGKGRGHINIYLYGSVPSSVHLIIKPKWDTISWSWRLQRPPIWVFGHNTHHLYQYQHPRRYLYLIFRDLYNISNSWIRLSNYIHYSTTTVFMKNRFLYSNV